MLQGEIKHFRQELRGTKREGSFEAVVLELGQGWIEFKPVEMKSERWQMENIVTERLPAKMLKMS